VKLTSSARLRIVTIAITTILTASIGSFIATQSYQNSLSAIDDAINVTVVDAAAAPNQELSAALFHIDEFSLDVSLFLVSRDGTITTINESTINLFDQIALADVIRAQDRIIAGRGASDYRFRSLEISGGDYLVVAGSYADAISEFKSNLFSVALTTALTTGLAFILLSIYIRRLKQRDDEDALQRMQAFLGDASHELRTPLTVIKGYVEMLSKGQMTAPSDQTRAFNRVTSEIGRMETLIHGLLLLAELGARAQREAENVDLGVLVTGLSDDFATFHPARNITIKIVVHGWVDLLRDYDFNLWKNALYIFPPHRA